MKPTGRFILGLVLVAGVSAGVSYLTVAGTTRQASLAYDSAHQQAVKLVAINAPSGLETDFTIAAENTVNAVVNITSKSMRAVSQPVDIFDYFFGYRGQSPQQQVPQVGIGSGVIITPDGYIITNNHVIEGADEVSVTTNDKEEYTAKVIGTDPGTDIALLKIDAKNLPTVAFGNSDDLKVGEWVLAVGNPMNLTSTVTAGIVSAKGRSLGNFTGNGRGGRAGGNLGIESFIQTDAAVNQGNSGGALVNLKGELVGINTAIISQTGSYSGYSLAIPVSIVARVVGDIKEFGSFQRPYLGVSFRDLSAEFAKEKNISVTNGVYIESVENKSGALEAGIKAGDVIVEVNGVAVKRGSELQEQVSRFHPGDKVKVKLLRDNKPMTVNVQLRNRQGGTDVVKAEGVEVLGAAFKDLTDDQKRSLNVSYGVQVTGLTEGKLKEAGVRKGFVILKINDVRIQSVTQLEEVVRSVQTSARVEDRGLFIVGIYPNGKVTYYAVDFSE